MSLAVRLLIHHWLQRTGNIRKYDWGGCHWLQKKWNQNRDEHHSKWYHSNPYICSCIFCSLLLWMYTQILSQTHPPYLPVCGAGCRLLWNTIFFYAMTCIQAATDVGIAVIPFWCSSRFWFHFFCSQWQPPQSFPVRTLCNQWCISVIPTSQYFFKKVFCLML